MAGYRNGQLPDENEKLPPFGERLHGTFIKFVKSEMEKTNHVPSQSDFVAWLGLTTPVYSDLKLGRREPTDRVLDILAERLGPEVYDWANKPRKMPKDKDLRYLSENWRKFSKKFRTELRERAKAELHDTGQEEDSNDENFKSAAAA